MSKINTISGFPEFLPKEQIFFNQCVDKIKYYFELNGFNPLETSAIERISTLIAKGGDDKEIYGIYRLSGDEENNKKELALRYDLTVPLARYVAQNYDKLTFPYRRYQIAPVWRGERAQAGRYRQFYQCDIDIIGESELSLIYDAEVPSIIYQIFRSLNIGNFTIRINNRNILKGLLLYLGINDDNITKKALRTIDKIEKISTEQFYKELSYLNIGEKSISELNEFINKKLTNDKWITYLNSLSYNETFSRGVKELEQLINYMRILGVEEKYFTIDPTIARGLDYYTGTIYETKLDEFPELGSICSGGRYENLAGSFTKKILPGVGISIGISRLITKLIEVRTDNNESSTIAPVLITMQNICRIEDYLKIGKYLRENGIKTENFLQNKKLSDQMKYANKKGFLIAIIADNYEFENNEVIVKYLLTGEQLCVPIKDLIKNINNYFRAIKLI